MAKHKKRRITYRQDATALDILMYEIEHGWIGLVLMASTGILLFILGAMFGWLKGN